MTRPEIERRSPGPFTNTLTIMPMSSKIEEIVRIVGNLRIKEALLITKLHPQINSKLELNTEYINN